MSLLSSSDVDATPLVAPSAASDASSADAGGDASAPAFDAVPVTPANHFVLHFHAAVYGVIAFVRSLREAAGDDPDSVLQEYPFLEQYLAESLRFMPEVLTWEGGTAWWMREIEAWEAASEAPLPLRVLSRTLGLSMRQRLAFLTVGLLEEDSRLGTLFVDVQAPLSSRRPTLEIVGRIVRHTDPSTEPWRVTRPLLEHRLLDVVDRTRPRAEWALRVPPLLWEAARGDVPDRIDDRVTITRRNDLHSLDDLVLPDVFSTRVRQAPALIASGRARTLVVRGTPGSDRLAVLHAVAGGLEHGVAVVRLHDERTLPSSLGPLCTMARLLPVLELDLAPGETRPMPSLPGYDGPIGVCLGPVGGLDALDDAVTLTMPPLGVSERRCLWKRVLGETASDDLDTIVRAFRLPGRYLRQAGETAVRLAALDGREAVTTRDVREACRTLNRQHLDTHAEALTPTGSWDQLVVGPATGRKLEELEQRCQHREPLLDHLGAAFRRNATPGVRALFTGPSGTGKTLAAKILAAEIGMDLYRVDLAAVLNKYVGETEKNLHRVLSTAEELDVILLLDEGDALLGRRTDVKSANDRYANIETNYLLQRLEHYRGIVVVTTNLGESIDRAFQRRMDVTVEFRPPRADERFHIWRLHLPDDHVVTGRMLDRMASRCALTGGQIRNAALHATLLAVDAGTPVGDGHVEAAVRSEYRKAGATCPLPAEQRVERDGGVHRFIEGLTG